MGITILFQSAVICTRYNIVHAIWTLTMTSFVYILTFPSLTLFKIRCNKSNLLQILWNATHAISQQSLFCIHAPRHLLAYGLPLKRVYLVDDLRYDIDIYLNPTLSFDRLIKIILGKAPKVFINLVHASLNTVITTLYTEYCKMLYSLKIKYTIKFNITLLKNCRLIIFLGVIFIINNSLALFNRIDNNNICFDLKFIEVQLQLYIPKWTDSICKKILHR
jgi:hypothetical protein